MNIRSLFEKVVAQIKNLFALYPQKHMVVGFITAAVALGFGAHMYFKKPNPSKIDNISHELKDVFNSFEHRLTQTENRLHNEIKKIEEQVKTAEAKLLRTEETLRAAQGQNPEGLHIAHIETKLQQEMSKIEAKLVEAEEKLKLTEGQLSTAGNKLQYTENRLKDIEAKVQNPMHTEVAGGQASELAQINKEIRKAVKKQIKAIERGE